MSLITSDSAAEGSKSKLKQLLTYKRRHMQATAVKISSDLSEICRDVSEKHRPRGAPVIECLLAHQQRNGVAEFGEVYSCEPIPACSSAIPLCKGPTWNISQRHVTEVLNADESSRRQITKPPVHARKKKRRRRVAEEGSDSEPVCTYLPSGFRCSGQSKRRVICNGIITQRKGKLDTNMFEGHLEKLWNSFSEDKRRTCIYLDSLWFSLYTKQTSKAKVLNWIKKKGIFSKKYVFVPIVQWHHWSLLIFCHFGESLESKIQSPCMLLLDSLQMANPRRLEPEIRKFVLDIYQTEERPENEKLIYKIPLMVPKVPQQRDNEECGSFVLFFLKLFVESAPDSFSLSKGYPYFMKEDWFTAEALEFFCEGLDS